MRLVVAATTAIAVIALVVFASRLAPSSAASVATSAAARPFVTADPGDHSRADSAAAQARIPIDEGSEHGRVAVRGLALPIGGSALPTDPDLLPNAPRDYRAGWHEGIDFPADPGTPVQAVAAGTVIRSDTDFVDWDTASLDAALEEAAQLGYTPAATLDRLRGRQVWIDHGAGVVSRYCHLASVADLAVGERVAAGTVVGTVGSSGYPEGGPHLHLEIRVGTSYLGDGLAGDALVAAIDRAFD
jgi:murein DD-endopeptidase MepM/ murein hydrolase activator NlpD